MSKRIVPDVELLSEESTHLYEVLDTESDLACVLIATSYLDYALASMLRRHFIESGVADKLLDPPRGSVASFASRCDLTYCLGLIPKSLYQNLGIVGKIRNSFAHSYLSLSLSDTGVSKLVDALIPPTVHQTITIVGSEAEHEGPAPMSLTGSTRNRFNIVIVLMVNSLLLTGLAMKHREKKPGGWQ